MRVGICQHGLVFCVTTETEDRPRELERLYRIYTLKDLQES